MSTISMYTRVVPSKGDGNCLFHSLLQGLIAKRVAGWDDESQHLQLRVAIVRFARQCSDFDLQDSEKSTKEAWLNAMETCGEWGDTAAIRMFCKMVSYTVAIFQNGKFYDVVERQFYEADRSKCIQVAFSGNHFDALIERRTDIEEDEEMEAARLASLRTKDEEDKFSAATKQAEKESLKSVKESGASILAALAAHRDKADLNFAESVALMEKCRTIQANARKAFDAEKAKQELDADETARQELAEKQSAKKLASDQKAARQKAAQAQADARSKAACESACKDGDLLQNAAVASASKALAAAELAGKEFEQALRTIRKQPGVTAKQLRGAEARLNNNRDEVKRLTEELQKAKNAAGQTAKPAPRDAKPAAPCHADAMQAAEHHRKLAENAKSKIVEAKKMAIQIQNTIEMISSTSLDLGSSQMLKDSLDAAVRLRDAAIKEAEKQKETWEAEEKNVKTWAAHLASFMSAAGHKVPVEFAC